MFNPIQITRSKIESIEIKDEKTAQKIVSLIPEACPVSKIKILGIQLPPICKLNPTFDQLMELRFKALCYLAEHETVQQ